MKIKDGFILREVAGKIVALPTDSDLDLNSMITLNEAGAFLWKQLQNDITEDELVAAVLREYDVKEADVRASVNAFVKKLSDNDFLE